MKRVFCRFRIQYEKYTVEKRFFFVKMRFEENFKSYKEKNHGRIFSLPILANFSKSSKWLKNHWNSILSISTFMDSCMKKKIAVELRNVKLISLWSRSLLMYYFHFVCNNNVFATMCLLSISAFEDIKKECHSSVEKYEF